MLTQDQDDLNRSMSSARVSVEWIFGDTVNCFKFLDFKKNLKIGLSAVGKMCITCAFCISLLPQNTSALVHQL